MSDDGRPDRLNGERVRDDVVGHLVDERVGQAAARLRAAVAQANDEGRITIHLPVGTVESRVGGPTPDAGDVMTDGQERQDSAGHDPATDGNRGPTEAGSDPADAQPTSPKSDASVEATPGDAGEPGDGRGPDPDPVSAVSVTGEPLKLKGERMVPRRAWLAAAAALLLVLIAAGVWQFGSGSGGGDLPGTMASDPEQRFLLAGSLPDGFALRFIDRDPEMPDGFETAETEVAVYGDTTDGDGWDGPVLISWWSVASSPDWWEEQRQYETELEWVTETIGDREWEVGLEPEPSEFGDVLAARHTDGSVQLQLIGVGVERTELLTAAEHSGSQLAVGPDGLPEGFEELARGPLDLAFPGMSRIGGYLTGLSLSYSDSDDQFVEDDDGALGVLQLPGVGEQAVELLNLWPLLNYDEDPDTVGADVEIWDLEVRGQSAVAQRVRSEVVSLESSGVAMTEEGDILDEQALADAESMEGVEAIQFELLTVQWYEAEIGAVVSVAASNMDDDEVLSFVEDLRVAEPGELEALLDEYPAASSIADEDFTSEAVEIDGEWADDFPTDDEEWNDADRFVMEYEDVAVEEWEEGCGVYSGHLADPAPTGTLLLLQGTVGGQPWCYELLDIPDSSPYLWLRQGPRENASGIGVPVGNRDSEKGATPLNWESRAVEDCTSVTTGASPSPIR
jgi:hypothetical protein